MTEFKVGDRVRGYNYPSGDVIGTIEVVHENGALTVCPDKGSSRREFHRKQCRRLVRKKRREVWIHEGDIAKFNSPVRKDFAHCDFKRFVEAKK